MNRSLIIVLTAAALLCGASAGAAKAGPCATQIAELEAQISHPAPSADIGPTAPQSIGAQLHHQPTPGAVQRAERQANAEAIAALDRAKNADAANDGPLCRRALEEARRLYGVVD